MTTTVETELCTEQRAPSCRIDSPAGRPSDAQPVNGDPEGRAPAARDSAPGARLDPALPVSSNEAKLFLLYRAMPRRPQVVLLDLIETVSQIPLPAREQAMDDLKDIQLASRNQASPNRKLGKLGAQLDDDAEDRPAEVAVHEAENDDAGKPSTGQRMIADPEVTAGPSDADQSAERKPAEAGNADTDDDDPLPKHKGPNIGSRMGGQRRKHPGPAERHNLFHHPRRSVHRDRRPRLHRDRPNG